MKILKEYKKFLLPALLAFLVASFYIIKAPGGIGSDAKEYDDLAKSILTGHFELNGVPSMEREPGYPLFRAVIKIFTESNAVILWIQNILYALIIILVGVTTFKIDARIGSLGAWGASLSYGLAFYPSAHLSEILSSFLLSFIATIFVFALEKPDTKKFVLIALAGGLLMLTRYPYVLVPTVLLFIIYLKNKASKGIFKKLLLAFLIISAIVSPWILRNYREFRQINVAGRSGAILYARSVQANAGWRTLPDTMLSILLGRGILFTVYPSNHSTWLEQWGDWWRNKQVVKEMWGENPTEIDAKRKSEAFKFIFGSSENLTKYILWSGINELRLLELTNPVIQSYGSPFEGTYGPLAKEGKLNWIQFTGLAMAHLVQFLWFIAIGISTYLGFKKYRYTFVTGLLLICILIPHLIADNIARYGAPLQPWLLSAIFMTIIFPIWHKYKQRQ